MQALKLGILVLVGLLKIGSTEEYEQCFWESRIVKDPVGAEASYLGLKEISPTSDTTGFLIALEKFAVADLVATRTVDVIEAVKDVKAGRTATFPFDISNGNALIITFAGEDTANFGVKLGTDPDFFEISTICQPHTDGIKYKCTTSFTCKDISLDRSFVDMILSNAVESVSYKFYKALNKFEVYFGDDKETPETIEVLNADCISFMQSLSDIQDIVFLPATQSQVEFTLGIDVALDSEDVEVKAISMKKDRAGYFFYDTVQTSPMETFKTTDSVTEEGYVFTRSQTCQNAGVDVFALEMKAAARVLGDPHNMKVHYCDPISRIPARGCVYPIAIPKGNEPTEKSSCYTAGGLCCEVDFTAKCTLPSGCPTCVPSVQFRCKTFTDAKSQWHGIIARANTKITINPGMEDEFEFSSDTEFSDQHENLYLGETIEIQCTDSESKVLTSIDGVSYSADNRIGTFTCLYLDEQNYKTTDILKTLDELKCESMCENVQVNSDQNIVLEPNVVAEKALPGETITISCVQGYGRPDGNALTFPSQPCSSDMDLASLQCTQCALTDDQQAAAVAFSSSYDATAVVPGETITNTCNTGYSHVGFTDESNRMDFIMQCDGRGLAGYDSSDVAIACSEDCQIKREGAAFDSNAYELRYESEHGIIMSIESVPVNKDYHVSCKEGGLQYGEPALLSCGGAGETIYVKLCKPKCHMGSILGGLSTNGGNWNIAKVGDTDVTALDTFVAYGSPITFGGCPSDHALPWTDDSTARTLTCDDVDYTFSDDSDVRGFTSVTQCFPTCMLTAVQLTDAAYDVANAEIIKGPSDLKFENTVHVARDVKVKLTCLNIDDTVQDMNENYVTIECQYKTATRVTAFYHGVQTAAEANLKPCVKGCKPQELIDLVDMAAENAKLVDDRAVDIGDIMGGFKQVKFMCISDEYFMVSPTETFESSRNDGHWFECDQVSSKLKLKDSADRIAPPYDDYVLQYSCVGKPSLKADASKPMGEAGSSVEITMPNGRKWVSDVIIQATTDNTDVRNALRSPVVCNVQDTDVAKDTLSCEKTFDDPDDLPDDVYKNGLDIVVSILVKAYVDMKVYTTSLEDITKTSDQLEGKMYFGPRAINKDKLSTEAVGVTSVTLTHADAATLETALDKQATKASLFLKIEIGPNDGTFEENKKVLYSGSPYDFVDPFGLLLTFSEIPAVGSLTPNTDYRLQMTTSNDKGDGGVSLTNFYTGFEAPTLTTSSTGPTDRTIKVTLDSLVGVTTSVKVTYQDRNGNIEEDLQENIAVFEQGGSKYVELTYVVTPEMEYTFTVTHVSDNQAKSEEATIIVTQGPWEYVVESSTKDSWVLGDTSAVIVLEPVADTTYYIKVYKGTDTAAEPVFEYTYVAPNNDRRKRSPDTVEITLPGLDPFTDYTVTFQTEKEIYGTKMRSPAVSSTFKTAACSMDGLKESYPTVKTEAGEKTDVKYFNPDASLVLVVTCGEGYRLKGSDLGAVDDKTSCGEEGWSSASVCEVIPVAKAADDDDALSDGAIAGIVIAVIVVLALLILLLICLVKPKKKRKKRTTETASKSYKPREKEQDDEADRPVNGDKQSMGSQEVKMEMKENEYDVADPADVVISNEGAAVDTV